MKIVCPECSFARNVPDEKIPPKTKIATCPKCGHRFQFRQVPSTSELTDPLDPLAPSSGSSQPQPPEEDIWDSLSAMAPTPDPSRQKEEPSSLGAGDFHGSDKRPSQAIVPWEHLDQWGFFPGFMETIKQVMLHPVEFFGKATFAPGMGKALVFYLLVAEIQALAQFFWQMTGVVPMMGDSAGGAALGLGMMGMGSAFILLMYPLLLTIMLFAMVGINHLCLRIFQAADQGFGGTFKAVTYGSAPMVLAVFPLVGPLAGALWTMVTTFFGYKYIHRTTTTKVVLAMLLPVLFTGFLVMLFLLLGNVSPDI